MSNKKGRNGNNRGVQPVASTKIVIPHVAAPDDLQQGLRDALADSRAVLPAGEVVTVTQDPLPPSLDLSAFWEIVKESKANYAAAERRAVERESEAIASLLAIESDRTGLSESTERLAHDLARLAEQESEYRNRVITLEASERSLASQADVLARQESAMKFREINAEAGFVEERKASLAALEQSAASLRGELAETERSIAEQRSVWLRERQTESERLRSEIESSVHEREQALADEEEQLRQERGELAKLERRLQRHEESLKEDRAGIDERVGQRMAREAESFKHQIQTLQDQLDQARTDRDTLAESLRQREESDRRFGHRAPEQVLAELDRLREENARIAADLAARPDAQAAERLRVLQAERADWQVERIDLLRKANDAEHGLARHRIAATELEMLRDQKIAAEARVAVLQQAREDLRTEVDQLIGRDNAKAPFPACSAMDAAEYRQVGETSVDIGSLESLVDDLQQRIAHDPQNPKKRLYYSKNDLQCFLGGLAMGRLILLQGISGTGKTSLPLAFARAVGTQFEDDDSLIQVQAGWRDPQDLIGHYNAFDKRFYEQKFLRALYRAGTPRWGDAIHVVVLDEMNLSHPEQYFSDMLSTLEQPIERRFIELHSSELPQAPALFVDGKRLKVPENVWFVGTANHDETTKDFADKTYDRSLVMEFAHVPEPFAVEPPPARLKPLSHKALQRAFAAAQKDRAQAAEQVSNFLGNELRGLLERDFGIGWGPRLEDQLKRFCPVVVAAGGTVGEAADHMLAMRLLRKLRNRHDNRENQLARLRERIQEAWPALDANQGPDKSIQILDSELARLGVDSGDGQ